MTAYYSKVAALHPEFPKAYKSWMSSEKSTFIFSPIDLNDRYNKYRKVFFFILFLFRLDLQNV